MHRIERFKFEIQTFMSAGEYRQARVHANAYDSEFNLWHLTGAFGFFYYFKSM